MEEGAVCARSYGHLDPIERAEEWRRNTVPLIYDWMSSRKFVWPHAAVQFGEEVRKDVNQTIRQNGVGANWNARSVYLAERTGDGKEPNTLLKCDARLAIENTNRSSDIAKPWLGESPSNASRDGISTQEFVLRKRLVHPGEVNKIRSIMPGVVVTHTDSPELYVWDFKQQQHREMNAPKHQPNDPTCTLVGHTKSAEYAISVAGEYSKREDGNSDAWVASGGSDCSVLVWRLADYVAHGPMIRAYASMKPGIQGGGALTGHTATVEDVSFGKNRNCLASVGRDSSLLLWDMRTQGGPTSPVANAHRGDINSVDFGGCCEYSIVTGGSDMHIRLWDSRKLVNSLGRGAPVADFEEHTEQVNNVAWNRYIPGVFASSSDDGQVLIWKTTQEKMPGAADVNCCPQLLFRHVGHNLEREPASICDFHWVPDEGDPWLLATISETLGGECGGSTLQIWRMSSLVHSHRGEAAAVIKAYGNAQT